MHWWTLHEQRAAVASGAVSSEELTKAALARAETLNPRLNALTEIFADEALEQARRSDARRAKGEPLGPLGGVPLVLKDNICLSWGRTTCASRMLAQYRSPYTATAAQRLLDAGAVVLGKGNLDEFAMGSSGEHSCFGPTRNPWDESRVPGGSSSGSCAAVAAGLAAGALGSDTGGSIRMPAGLCNVVGVKPTYGRVSRYGLVAYASSLDQIGPFARTVADAALLTQTICGPDAHDATCAAQPAPDLLTDLESPMHNIIVGVPSFARSSANHPGVAAALEAAIEALRRLGVGVVDVDLPHAESGIAAYYIVATAEASSNLARFDGVRYGHRTTPRPGDELADLYARSRAEGFGPEVQRRIMLGTHVLSAGYAEAYYVTALKVRRLIKRDYDRAFAGEAGERGGGGAARMPCQAILLPSSPAPAFPIGAKSGDPLSLYLEDVYTVGVNLAGLPAITVPGGFVDVDGAPRRLPVGLQLVGPAWSEPTLFRVARMLEQETGHGRTHCPIA